MNNLKLPALILLTLLIITSCGKVVDEFYLSAEEQAQIPFQGYEIITFITDNKDTIVIQAGERINTRYESRTCTQCYDYVVTESEYIQFQNGNIKLHLNMSSTRYPHTKNSFHHTISIDSISFSHGFASPLSIENLRSEEIHYDSLLVNNKVYFNIFSDTLTHIGMIDLNPYPVRMYYSLNHGVIKYDFSDGTSWELEEIKWTD